MQILGKLLFNPAFCINYKVILSLWYTSQTWIWSHNLVLVSFLDIFLNDFFPDLLTVNKTIFFFWNQDRDIFRVTKICHKFIWNFMTKKNFALRASSFEGHFRKHIFELPVFTEISYQNVLTQRLFLTNSKRCSKQFTTK